MISRRQIAFGSVLAALVATGCSRTADDGAGATPAEVGAASGEVAPVALERRPATLEEELAEKVDPGTDGWTTEVLSDAAQARLKELAKLLERPGKIDAAALEDLVGEGFLTTALRPGELEEVADGVFTVRRWNGGDLIEHQGAAGLAAALRELAAGLGPDGKTRVALKLVAIEAGEDSFAAGARYEGHRRSEERGAQQTAGWRLVWSTPRDGDAPRLLEVALESYEEATIGAPGGALYADVTAAVLGGEEAYRRQVLPGIDHWLTRVSLLAGMSIVGHHGLAVGDVDGDGLEDLYVTDAAGLPNRLWLQQPDGTAREAAAEAGVDWLESSTSALFADLDEDGDQDLAVATRRRLLIAENDGRGRFTLRHSFRDAVSSAASLSAADFDQDGDLDLYLCAYDGDPENRGLPGPVPYHDARNGGANALYRNLGGLRFENATAAVGLDENNDRFSFAAAWADYDRDGDLDLYVANDFGRNNLYRNDGGRFRDVAAEAGVEDVASGMAATWGDADRDGWMDVYVSNMYSSAGNRIAYQRRFTDAAPLRTAADLQRMARGNTLFLGSADGRFRDRSLEAGVSMGRWAWGSKFADLDGDGWLDLAVVNGYVTAEDTDDL